jgi:hypothetical protein
LCKSINLNSSPQRDTRRIERLLTIECQPFHGLSNIDTAAGLTEALNLCDEKVDVLMNNVFLVSQGTGTEAWCKYLVLRGMFVWVSLESDIGYLPKVVEEVGLSEKLLGLRRRSIDVLE